MKSGRIELRHVLVFFACFVLCGAGSLVLTHMLRAATLHHVAHITVCNLGAQTDPALLAGWPDDVRAYATETPCWWAPARWVAEGTLAAALYGAAGWLAWPVLEWALKYGRLAAGGARTDGAGTRGGGAEHAGGVRVGVRPGGGAGGGPAARRGAGAARV